MGLPPDLLFWRKIFILPTDFYLINQNFHPSHLHIYYCSEWRGWWHFSIYSSQIQHANNKLWQPKLRLFFAYEIKKCPVKYQFLELKNEYSFRNDFISLHWTKGKLLKYVNRLQVAQYKIKWPHFEKGYKFCKVRQF